MQAFIVFQQAYLAFCLSRFLYVIDNYVEDLFFMPASSEDEQMSCVQF